MGVCLSCYNRELELKRGRNARGTPPIKLKPLHDLKIAVAHNDVIVTKTFHALDLHEVLLRESRENNGEITFGRAVMAHYRPRL